MNALLTTPLSIQDNAAVSGPIDRCDACWAAAAMVRVSSTATRKNLDFCGHDYAQHEIALDFRGFSVLVDNRASLLVKPGGDA